jgi:uroporphyrin-III C-methyltransferase/precorrin-2 dehydrogenase/sirohydrochlorin ferrochelatase
VPAPAAHRALYPLFLNVRGRRVVVVGAGAVAERKVNELLAAGAAVDVVAKDASEAIEALARRGEVSLARRPFDPGDLDGTWLVVAATGDEAVQRAVFAAAEARRVFVVAVDDPANGSAHTPAIVVREPYVVAISSAGETPALTRLLREILEQILPDEQWVEAARALRAKWKSERTPMGSRFPELVRLFRDRAREGGEA